METHRVTSSEIPFDFDSAIKHATAIAYVKLGDNMLLSWYDRERDIVAPAHVSEWHEDCAVAGFQDYALNRDGALVVDFDEGRFVFCFISLEDIAPKK